MFFSFFIDDYYYSLCFPLAFVFVFCLKSFHFDWYFKSVFYKITWFFSHLGSFLQNIAMRMLAHHTSIMIWATQSTVVPVMVDLLETTVRKIMINPQISVFFCSCHSTSALMYSKLLHWLDGIEELFNEIDICFTQWTVVITHAVMVGRVWI